MFVLFSVYGGFAYMYVHHVYMSGAYRGQKRVLNPLELES